MARRCALLGGTSRRSRAAPDGPGLPRPGLLLGSAWRFSGCPHQVRGVAAQVTRGARCSCSRRAHAVRNTTGSRCGSAASRGVRTPAASRGPGPRVHAHCAGQRCRRDRHRGYARLTARDAVAPPQAAASALRGAAAAVPGHVGADAWAAPTHAFSTSYGLLRCRSLQIVRAYPSDRHRLPDHHPQEAAHGVTR
jgi:hypothetical protein